MLAITLALHVALATPQPVIDLDTGKLKGEVVRLAWSLDGTQFYLQAVERDRLGRITRTRHYVVSPRAKDVSPVDQEPPWAAEYWMWKAARTAPDTPAFRIDVAERQETVSSTASPVGGTMAKGGVADPAAGSTLEEAANAAYNRQALLVRELSVKGDTIGVWVNEPVLPGFSFAWAPSPLKLLAFARRDRKDGGPIVVLDEHGEKQELSGPKAAILPAWSDDGKRLAWLERKDKRKYTLMVATITVQ